jgi:hypothetical protein
MIELVEDVCTEPLPDGVRVYRSHMAGNLVASCDRCGYVCGYWECGCELAHDCGEYLA